MNTFAIRATSKEVIQAKSEVDKKAVITLKMRDDASRNKIIKQIASEFTPADISKLKMLYGRWQDGIAVANKLKGDARLSALDKASTPVADFIADHLGMDKKERRGKPGKYGDTMLHTLSSLAGGIFHKLDLY